MVKASKKVSINAVDSVIREHFSSAISQDWHGVEINIRRTLPFKDMMSFVNEVVDSCFDKDSGYLPEVLDFALKSSVILRYTNVSLPDNLEHRYSVLYDSDLVELVYLSINTAQLDEMVAAINRKIDYLCETNISAVVRRADELVSSFEELQKSAKDLFDGVSREDITRLIGAIGDEGLREEKIVEAYRKQLQSDGAKDSE